MEEQQNATHQRASWDPNWQVPKLNTIVPFEEVQESVHKLHDLRIDPKQTSLRARGITSDENVGLDVINLNSLQFSSAGQVMVPGQGVLEMTPWARQQLGAEIGVRWDKFFGEMSPDQIQSAVTNHLTSRGNKTLKKVIARKHAKGEEKASSVGILRAFVSPSYAEIPDIQIIDRMESVVGLHRMDEMGFYSNTSTDKATFWSIVFREPINLLGTRGRDEFAYYGLRLRNSEVGAYSLVGDGYLLKLVCTNGMVAGFTEDRWLYRRHHHIDSELLDALLESLFTRLADNKDNIVSSNKMLVDTKIENPNKEIRSFLQKHHRPKVEQKAAVKALLDDLGIAEVENEEDIPPCNAYNIMQGIARLGMATRETPERQHEIEVLAGDYMRSIVSRQAVMA